MGILYIDVMNDDDSKQIGDHRRQNLYPEIKSDVEEAYTSTTAIADDIKNSCQLLSGGLITLSGHGDFDYVKDYQNNTIFHANDNDLGNYVLDKIVHLHACFAADSLGPEMVRQGCNAFFGYSDYFKAPHEDDPDYYLIDQFMNPDKTVVLELNNGESASKAANMAVLMYDEAIEFVDNSSQNGNYHILIRENKEAFCHPNVGHEYGSPSARITSFV